MMKKRIALVLGLLLLGALSACGAANAASSAPVSEAAPPESAPASAQPAPEAAAGAAAGDVTGKTADGTGSYFVINHPSAYMDGIYFNELGSLEAGQVVFVAATPEDAMDWGRPMAGIRAVDETGSEIGLDVMAPIYDAGTELAVLRIKAPNAGWELTVEGPEGIEYYHAGHDFETGDWLEVIVPKALGAGDLLVHMSGGDMSSQGISGGTLAELEHEYRDWPEE